MSRRKGALSWDDFPRRKNEDGHPLCRKCGTVLTGKKTAWCGPKCLKDVKLMVDWNYIRRTIRRRDHYTCVLCGNRGREVDHIVELVDGGSWWEPSNLRTLCTPCHKTKTAKMRKTRAKTHTSPSNPQY